MEKTIEGAPAALTDEQRDEIRNILSRFGGVSDKKKKTPEVQIKDDETKDGETKEVDILGDAIDKSLSVPQEDLLKGALGGKTIEWHDLTSETMKYGFLREICCQFEPYIRDEIPMTPKDFKYACTMLGLEPHNNSNTLISCAVEQADPLILFHLQVALLDNGDMIIQRLRFIC